ncbi:cellulase family glycosylhydrolase [Klebsiella pneumoniae]|uniref:cellulase family glycosylhydrolase n=1 Tax=Klebsiella pneumoniae TaxID=573 RepID=UPI002A0A18BA|nr:cellulase family glycosylhydrolase [Klebsiella pneumoniae]
MILNYGNSNYKENTGGHKNIRLSSDEEIEGFINYVDWVSKHFGKKKIIFEIWNEWNHSKPKYNNNSLESALDYVALVKKSSAIIKRNNPNAIIIAGGFNPLSRKEMNWGKEIVLNGIMTYVDGLSIHPYDWTHKQITPANISLDKIRKAHDELLSYSSGHEVNLYITEVGVSSFSKNLLPIQILVNIWLVTI